MKVRSSLVTRKKASLEAVRPGRERRGRRVETNWTSLATGYRTYTCIRECMFVCGCV